MSVTEVRMGIGTWSIRLRDTTPKQIIDTLDQQRFGHIAILPGRMDVKALGDGLLAKARYVGVYMQLFKQPDEYEIQGHGMTWWGGDSDNRGDIFSNAKTFSASTFAQTVGALMPSSGSLTLGTVHSISASGTFTGTVKWDTPRAAWSRICTFFTSDTANPVEYRVNGNGTDDFGEIEELYPSTVTPTAILVRRKESGRDLRTVSIEADMSFDTDVEDYITQMFVLGEGDGDAVPVGSASAAVVPYNHLFGSPVRVAEVFNDSDATAVEVDTVAAVALSENEQIRRAAQIGSDEFDIKGTFGAGDSVWVFDPRAGFVNPNNEIMWQGAPINPVRLRVDEISWPVPTGWTVAFRDGTGTWHDLSNYYAPESGRTSIAVGGFSKRLYGGLSPDLNGRATPDSSIPAAPTFGTFYTGTYESPTTGETRAQVQLSWTRPTNTDGSTITDLSHYEIRYRADVAASYPATHAEMATKRWNQLLTHAQPLTPLLTSQWHHIIVGPDITQHTIQELTAGVAYDFQVRAVDIASPPNVGAWSTLQTFTVARDQTAPNQPAPPTVAGSRIAIQVTHELGSSAGGTFNLASDLHHLEVHVGGGPDFYCDNGSMVGRLTANAGMMLGSIPAVGTFQIESVTEVYVKVVAVDRTGNKSSASEAATVTALLLDDVHISDLSVSKVTAGTITATWVMAGEIKTAESGARARVSSDGFETYNAAGSRTFFASAVTGDVTVAGTFKTAVSGQRVEIRDTEPFSTIYFYGSTNPDRFAFINAIDLGTGDLARIGLGFNTSRFDDSLGTEVYNRLYMNENIQLARVNAAQASIAGQLFMTEGTVGLSHEGGGTVDVFSEGGNVTITSLGASTDVFSKTALGSRLGLLEMSQVDVFIGFDGVNASGGLQYFQFTANETRHVGRWENYADLGATQGIMTADLTTAANVTSVTTSFGTAKSTNFPPVYSIRDNEAAGSMNANQINGFSTSSFTIEFDTATNGAAAIHFIAFRLDS